MKALLVSTYELGHQPFGLASPAAWLRAAGWDVRCVDTAKERLEPGSIASAHLIGFHLPMHTATRLAAPLVSKARALNSSARICAYGLYAPLNEAWLRSLGVDAVFGGEFEEALTRYAVGSGAEPPAGERSTAPGRADGSPPGGAPGVARLRFLVPDRTGLPSLERYAALQLPDGGRKVVGYTEASRGCRHLCRHCPVVPVYGGQFRIVQIEVVLADIAAQVRSGARHVTFGDPDFFNGPTHAMRVVEALHRAHPDVSYDVTIKIEHLLRHRGLLSRLAETGCLFVTSAAESLDDLVLARLEKGHTRRDFVEAVSVCRDAGLTLVPTFVAFHPWLTLGGYCDLLETIEALDLVEHVAPIQLALRLLVPEGSRLLALDEVRALVGLFDPATLTYRWLHRDPAVDDLQRAVAAIVGVGSTESRREVFDQISELAHRRAGRRRPPAGARSRVPVPFRAEPWYCCAEPNPEQVNLV
jgi:radical SAM superfamily enzyme YgiQ (UPF0313 family)